MEDTRHTDPFLWDEDAVILCLCSSSRPCSRDLREFASRIRENEIDGHSLLTYDLVGEASGHDLRNELYQALNVRLLKHKNALGEAVMKLRRRSRLFQQWKLDHFDGRESEERQSHDHVRETSTPMRTTPQSNAVLVLQKPLAVDEPAVVTPTFTSTTPKPNPLTSHDNTGDPHGVQTKGVVGGKPSKPDISAQTSLPSAIADSSTPPNQLKRKRVAPQQLQEQPVNLLPVPLPTEADNLHHDEANPLLGTQDSASLHDSEGKFAYLGKRVIHVRHVKSSHIPLTRQLHGEGKAIRTAVPTRFPPGKRRVIDRLMRRLLLKNSRNMNALDGGAGLVESSGSLSESDKILELDDLPDELDKETREEMEMEQAEVTKKLEASSSLLSSEKVQQILDEEVSEVERDWNERKLPKYCRKANSLWKDASRRGTKLELFVRAVKEAKRCDDRIKTLRAEIMEQAWERERHLRLQAKCLEQSVEDRLYQSWLADILNSRFAPAKPPKLMAPLAKKAPLKRKLGQVLSDEEILTSSDDESFVVDDSPVDEAAPHVELAQFSPTVPIKRSQSPVMDPASPLYIDLTQIDSSVPNSPAGKPNIGDADLSAPKRLRATLVDPESKSIRTKPNKPKMVPEPEPEPDPELEPPSQTKALSWPAKYHDVKRIASFPPSHWSKRKERYALVISLLWRLGHSRRSAILELVGKNEVEESFNLTVARYISSPIQDVSRLTENSPDTLAFDVSRLFLCFLKVKNLKESRLVNLKSASIQRLRTQRGGNSWAVWHDFLTQMAPLFPQDNQIWREDVSDVEGISGDAEGESTPVINMRRSARKEIIQNKDAVDLREREKRRAEELEARRLRLRANLGSATTMSRDKSRLIINESKQDDQSFIYINQYLGDRIKDHQIEGVRFMWNQIIQDSALRQGCLLAHSMGLGKTMQVITLLVAIQEASRSLDPSTVSQIPSDLQQSKTLVLCPAGLVNNWIDELLLWDVDKILGGPYAIDSTMSGEERVATAEQWSQSGGVLVIGYTMLKSIYGRARDSLFFEKPNLVVADEAHTLKNPETQAHAVCSRFRTMSRIAMTGSPLANDIEEYHSMIDWVAPNYLGPLSEFRCIYAKPIQQGLSTESVSSEKRRALKMLQVLKQTVAPKVHRATIKSCMEEDLPQKREFVLRVAPRPSQVSLYNLYLSATRQKMTQGTPVKQAAIFDHLEMLGLICDHPGVFVKSYLRRIKKQPARELVLSGETISDLLDSFGDECRLPSASTKIEMLIKILDCAREKGDKVLVFTQSIMTLDYLQALFMRQNRVFERLDGETPIRERQDLIKTFNSSQAEFALISTTAGGVGLNIHGANRVVILHSRWNPVHEQQAVGRAYRIGQTKPVTVYHFVTAGTFEEDRHARAVFKSQLASRVVDKKNPISWGNRKIGYAHDVIETQPKDLTSHIGQDSILDQLILHSGSDGLIREIIPTDTYEEEDEKAPLSLEEQREADNMVRMHQLRNSNPEEFQRLKDLNDFRSSRSTKPGPNNAAHNVSSAASVAIPSPTLNEAVADGQLRRAAGFQLLAASPMQPTGANGPTPAAEPFSHPMCAPAVAPAQDVIYVAASKASIQHSSPLMPIPGAQTYFSHDARDSSKPPAASELDDSQSTRPPVQAQAQTQDKQNPFSTSIKCPLKDKFRDKVAEKLDGVLQRHPTYPEATLAEVLNKITDSIHATRQGLNLGFLPDSRHWNTLIDLAENDRFVAALISGVLEAEPLARMNIDELTKTMDELKEMPRTEFKTQVRRSRPSLMAGGSS
ncbi:hypothetical protein E4U19_004036 [Claviceps sp. Clav32 group G5]|nr:hypothetical protein E4U19_004036 [Claviceps sp. Clav32 group G5]